MGMHLGARLAGHAAGEITNTPRACSKERWGGGLLEGQLLVVVGDFGDRGALLSKAL